LTELTDELDAGFVTRWLTTTAEAITREADHLTELDSAIGDADHGINLQRGFKAVLAALEKDPPSTPGATLMLAGRHLVSSVGGASGPLYGTLLRRAGKALGEGERVTGTQLASALRTGVDAVIQLGAAQAGEKTMLDALLPALDALEAASASGSGSASGSAFAAASAAADEGALATVPMRARKGRASYLGERSEGHQDPGATSSALLIAALAEVAAGE
jgi:dihydroxyacetone kinase-like protein